MCIKMAVTYIVNICTQNMRLAENSGRACAFASQIEVWFTYKRLNLHMFCVHLGIPLMLTTADTIKWY